MEFINATYFEKGVRRIDNVSGSARLQLQTQAANKVIDGYIEQYQSTFLTLSLGSDLAAQVSKYLDGDEEEKDMETLLDQLREAFAYYVMHFFLRYQQTASSTVGEKVLKGGNDAHSSAQKQVYMWNEMVTLMRAFVLWAQESQYNVVVDKCLLEKMNVYGL